MRRARARRYDCAQKRPRSGPAAVSEDGLDHGFWTDRALALIDVGSDAFATVDSIELVDNDDDEQRSSGRWFDHRATAGGIAGEIHVHVCWIADGNHLNKVADVVPAGMRQLRLRPSTKCVRAGPNSSFAVYTM